MIAATRHILAFALAVLATPALTCSPAHNEAAQTVAGENCAVRHVLMPVGASGLTEAENLWLGFTAQRHYDGNACYVTEVRVIVDCAKNKAMTFGTGKAMSIEEHMAASEGSYGQLYAEYAEMPASLDVLADTAVEAGLVVERFDTLAQPVVLGPSGKSFDLACACRLFYPDTKGAKG